MKILSFIIGLLLFSACQLNFMSANLINPELASEIKAPSLEIKKEKVTMKLPVGTSFVSFPLLPKDNSILANNENIIAVWQNDKNQILDSVNSEKAYFIETNAETKINWTLDVSQKYASNLLNTGDNFISLNRGADVLLIKDIKINGQNLLEGLDNIKMVLDNFYIIDNNNEFYDLLNTDKNYSELSILNGSGAYIKVKSFAKITWPLSEYWAEQEAIILAKQKAEAEKKEKAERDAKEASEKKIDDIIKQKNAEISKKVFLEIKELPVTIFKMIKSEDKESLSKIIASKSLLLQVHDNNEVIKNLDYLSADYWLKRKELVEDAEYVANDRRFDILTSNDLQLLNTANRAIAYLELAKSEREIDSSTGIAKFYQPLIFIKQKDCSWVLDPIATIAEEQKINKQTNFYSSEIFLNFLKENPITLAENVDFTNSRQHCEPQVKDVATRIITTSPYPEIKNDKTNKNNLLKNHYKACEAIEENVYSVDTLSLEHFVYDDPDEKEIKGLDFPKIAFNINICKNYWPYILENANFIKIMSGKYEGEDADKMWQMIVDDSFYLYLGANPSFDCKNIADADKKDYCYFGQGIVKKSSTPCKKIKSPTVKSYCAGDLAQNKNSYELSCEKVFGVYDKKKDRDNETKIVSLRNCRLDMLSAFAANKKDCNILKKRFLFFFKKSTPSYEHCLKVVNKEFATGFADLGLTEDELLIEMKLKETTNEETEKKAENKTEKIEEKTEIKSEEKTEEKSEKAEEKSEEKIEEKIEEKAEEKAEKAE